MTLVKFKKPHRLPWYDNMFTDLLSTDRLLTNDFFMENKWIPAMNIKENDENFEIEVAAPGFNKEEFEIVYENGTIRISVEHKEEKEEKEETFTKREFNYQSFTRSFTLPENVNEDEKIEATYSHGILKLVLAKLKESEIHHKRIIEVS